MHVRFLTGRSFLLMLCPVFLFSSSTLPPPSSTLFPYTTLFRSMLLKRRVSPSSPPRAQDHSEAGACSPMGHWRTCAGLAMVRSEEHTSELQSHSDLVCRLLLEKKKKKKKTKL